MDEAENKRKLQQERLERLRYVQMNRQDKLDSSKNIIMRAVRQEYPDIDRQEAEKVTRELVLAPKKSSIKIGNREVPVADLQFQIALTIESLGSETSSEQEYFSWFTESAEIMQHMNDGFVSHEDLNERNEFLEMSYQREAELMVCISLYQNSVFKGAKDKANELTYKLTKLRQMRSMIKQTTKDQADRKVEKSEYEKALEYYRAVRQLKEHDLYWNLPEPALENMGRAAYEAGLNHGYADNGYGVSHAGDRDMQPNYVWYDWLREEMVKSMNPSQYQSRYDHSMGEMMMMKRMGNENRQTRESLAAHIERLSGRRPPLKDAPEYNYSEVRRRAFDVSRFRELQGREA